ncbi:Cif family virulence factor [Lysobacter solisilvae (ex Woo and Kim 2020)]|uniref:DUF4440 domain-containing protein n=1 Tax=Agrilutibacter terrestris TaxID=2865112 RepID=A0A7H0FYM0_9GAMM|nr:hypothetical protein [Lysobacter terrestris]QNP41136.1 hypothetical protein H8B22_02605 [Lysobacter terrestris]
MRTPFIATLLLSTLLLAACGGGDAKKTTADGGTVEQLPTPTGAAGGVTGMPARPGPGPIGAPVAEQPEVALDADGNPILPEAAQGEATADEPSPDDAVAVIRDYYAAINSGDFGRAYALWSDDGRASGQSPAQFAAGFGDTTGVSVEMQAPGSVEAAAGSRYIEIPVTLVAAQRDGGQRRFSGRYTLRRAVVDGATAEQRAWRIASANLQETAP